ncbi:MAG: hypothetical protein V3T80_03595 [Kiloniellales bacterium]|jgi:hypothetical protein
MALTSDDSRVPVVTAKLLASLSGVGSRRASLCAKPGLRREGPVWVSDIAE